VRKPAGMIVEMDVDGAIDGGSLTAGDGDSLIPTIDEALR